MITTCHDSIYLAPREAKYVMKIDVADQTVSPVGVDLSSLTESRSWSLGCFSPDDGNIYFSPSDVDHPALFV